MNLCDETQMILNQYGLRAKKRLGQNFLINQDVIDNIVTLSDISENDVVIEIGPGIGSLTKALIGRAKKVIAIELDDDMVNVLNGRFQGERLEVLHDDVLKVDLNSIVNKYDKVKVVANLPYYITSPIVMMLLEGRFNIESITVMVQKEVAERFCSENGSRDYGAITVSVKYFSKPSIIIDVPKDNFLPVPEVDSCVVKFDILKKPSVDVIDEKVFFRIIRCAFNQRRKTINNSLASGEFSKEIILNVLDKLGLDYKLRAEDLSIFDFANIANEIVRMSR